jgi:hypothetical protein
LGLELTYVNVFLNNIFKFLNTNNLLSFVGVHIPIFSRCNILVAKPEGKRPFGRPRRRWEDNFRRDFRENGRKV